MRAATLTCLTGADVGRTFALAGASVEIGRGLEASVRLRDLAVSRRHARIHHQEDSYFLEDLGSPNGVSLNGQRVKEPTALTEGDVIGLGRTLLRFQAPVAEPSLEPAPPSTEASTASGATAPPPPPVQDCAEPSPEPPRVRWEAWLIGLGGVLALTGLLVTWALTR
jgi:pSer/pThr/pTyr-binding forkhead associated (FHA) protein